MTEVNNTVPKIILFDGDCNFCTGWVLWVIKRDKKKIFRFSAMQLEAAEKYRRQFSINEKSPQSVVFIEGANLFLKADAAIRILQRLGGIYRAAGVLYIIPRFIRNGVYDFIAKRRFKWFGKRTTCYVPDASIRSRFL